MASIVQQAAPCRAPGEIGALLRREGLFSSQLTLWRKQYQAGVRRALSQRRGPTAARTAETVTIATLERENAQWRDELARAELVIACPKKLAALLDHPARESSTAPS
jgi:transposase-like protein